MKVIVHCCDVCEKEMEEPSTKWQLMPKGWRTLELIGPSGQRRQDRVELCPVCVELAREVMKDELGVDL